VGEFIVFLLCIIGYNLNVLLCFYYVLIVCVLAVELLSCDLKMPHRSHDFFQHTSEEFVEFL